MRWQLELGWANDNFVIKRAFICLVTIIHPVTHRAALHKNYRLVSIFARHSRRQTSYIFGLGLAHHLFKADRRNVVAFVNNQVTVIANQVTDNPFLAQALDHGYIEISVRFVPTTAKLTNVFRVSYQETGSRPGPTDQVTGGDAQPPACLPDVVQSNKPPQQFYQKRLRLPGRPFHIAASCQRLAAVHRVKHPETEHPIECQHNVHQSGSS